jgi:uncharacterized protein (TIGR02145 family)
MAENLRVTKYNDGTAITKITDSAVWYNISYNNLTTPAYCFYNNTTNADSIKKFGALYNWYVVDTKKLAPAGWHVPTDSEWEVSIRSVNPSFVAVSHLRYLFVKEEPYAISNERRDSTAPHVPPKQRPEYRGLLQAREHPPEHFLPVAKQAA